MKGFLVFQLKPFYSLYWFCCPNEEKTMHSHIVIRRLLNQWLGLVKFWQINLFLWGDLLSV